MTDGVPRTIVVPGDKSLSHRALMLAAIAQGPSRLRGLLPSADVLSTAECLRRCGASIPPLGDDIVVDGQGMTSLRAPTRDLDCGNSGTSARLLTGLLAGLGLRARLTGDASLSRRPMRRVTGPLAQMGAQFVLESGDGLPMRIERGVQQGIDFASPTASAQVKSAVLLAGLAAGVAVRVHEPQRSRDHTERMLRSFGVPLTVDGTTVALAAGPHALPGFAFDVPGDPSSAAFFAGYAALTGVPIRTSRVTVNPTRIGFLAVLAQMGADVRTEAAAELCGEPIASLVVGGGLARGVRISGDIVPSLIDELPLLACLAATVPGETQVTGAHELRVKESDRIAAVVANLRAIGADADELPDGFIVRGRADARFAGAVQTHGDHRLAMAFGILGALPGNAIVIDDPDCVAVSFPEFWSTLRGLSA